MSQIHLSKYIAKFQLPSSTDDLAKRVESQGLTLREVTTSGQKIEGIIIINEPEPNMEVVVRWTDNNWITYHETPAVAVSDVAGNGDQFTFTVLSPEMAPCIKFALRCNKECAAYWDNNMGQDYCFEAITCSVWDP